MYLYTVNAHTHQVPNRESLVKPYFTKHRIFHILLPSIVTSLRFPFQCFRLLTKPSDNLWYGIIIYVWRPQGLVVLNGCLVAGILLCIEVFDTHSPETDNGTQLVFAQTEERSRSRDYG
jgi:hypothetical protein